MWLRLRLGLGLGLGLQWRPRQRRIMEQGVGVDGELDPDDDADDVDLVMRLCVRDVIDECVYVCMMSVMRLWSGRRGQTGIGVSQASFVVHVAW